MTPETEESTREIRVEDMYECPFKGSFTYQLSELTSGVDDVCLLQDGAGCQLKGCPLKTAKTIKVIWAKNGKNND